MRSSSMLHYGWIILVIAVLVVFGSLGLARFGYTMILPSMQSGLKLSNTEAGMLATSNLVGYLALSAIGGAMASRLGPKIVITIGLAVVGFAMILTGYTESFLSASLWRGITGIGSGASNVPVMGLLAAWFASRRRGMAAGVAVTGSSIALIILGPAVPLVLSAFGDEGWREAWYIFGAITLLLALAVFLLLKNSPQEKGLLPIGSINKEEKIGSEEPKIQWIGVYRSFSVWHLGFIYAAFGFSYIIYMTFFTKHLITSGGYSTKESGNLFMLMGWFSLSCGLLWGTISDIIGRKYALIIVFVIHAISFSLFGIWRTQIGFTISAILFGISAWSIPAIMAAACGDKLGPRLAPAALGFITLLFGIGQAAGPGIAGMLADSRGSFIPAFILAGCVALCGAVLSIFYRAD